MIDGDLSAGASHEILQVFAAFTNESACGRIGDVQRDKHAVGAVKKCSPTIRAVEKDVQGGGVSSAASACRPRGRGA